MVQEAEEHARKLKHAQKSHYRLVHGDASLEIPTAIGQKLAWKRLIYVCSGCPNWHIDAKQLPDGVSEAGFVNLMRICGQ